MVAVIQAPVKMIESVASLQFPPKADQLLQTLMDRNTNGLEYCRTHQSLQGATFHVEHIVPSAKRGSSHLLNLAWC